MADILKVIQEYIRNNKNKRHILITNDVPNLDRYDDYIERYHFVHKF